MTCVSSAILTSRTGRLFFVCYYKKKFYFISLSNYYLFLPHKKTRVVDITVDATQPLDYIVELDRVCQEVSEAVAENYQFIVLSDKAAGPERHAHISILFPGSD